MNAPDDVRARNRNRLLLIGIFALFFGSMLVAGVLRFSGWRPAGTKNHGQLLDPPGDLRKQVPRLVGGGDYAWNPVARTWRIIVPAPRQCAIDCEQVLGEIDTVWQLMGKDADEVDVLWLCDTDDCDLPAGAPRPATLRRLQPHPAMRAELLRLEQGSAPGLPAYIIDPNGFVILRYAPGFDPAGLRSDLAKLVKLK